MLLVTAIALTALSGCSDDSGGGKQAAGKEAQVATLSSPTAKASAAPKPQRPRERLDTTPEDFEAMLGPYNKCLEEHGGIVRGKGPANGAPRPATKKETAKHDKANRICEPLHYPLPPWEKDPANPEARDFGRAVVKCLKEKGVKYVEVAEDGMSPALGGDQNDPRSISMGLELAPECEREVAAAMK
ncbi:hypothetical protein [Jidongwangia harbinensis]|uniref:hypothetical protein n=1 Tax=Jidongwangia harbinensis TaxID=2878561 RepID=UPI001CD9B3B2|nr:hypothetical protein [Jidongwangia harbinensis]MCA2219479.1 hypothetical protein [Jidongwangia harbinensis]